MTPPLDAALGLAAALLRPARRVTVLTGAGVSAESGVPTFRGADSLREGQRVEDVASPHAFRRDPESLELVGPSGAILPELVRRAYSNG
jgi:hypothetical protein